MILGSDSLFNLPELHALLGEELARVPGFAARQPAGRALLLQACAANRGLPVDTRHLGAVRLHSEGARLQGDVCCQAGELPWQDDAFQLVLAQHVGDAQPASGEFLDELARVLAPGGVLLWFGLNPWSPWLAWIHWQARRGAPVPRVTLADVARQRLHKRHLATGSAEYLGGCWPQRGEAVPAPGSRVIAPLRGAYVIAASKQRAVLMPLRPRRLRERVASQPQLAGTPSRRASA